MRTVKLGIIGSGIVVRDLHWPALKTMRDRFKIVNVASRNSEKARAFAEMCGSDAYCTSPEELLADENVEAVVIAYPFEKNYELTKMALEAGKHVFVEKPMAASIEQAAEMCEWEKQTACVTMIAECFRYRKLITDARELLDQGIIGQPKYVMYQLVDHFGRDSKWLTQSSWRKDCFGGIQLDKDIHFVSVLRDLMGEVKYALGYHAEIGGDVGMDSVNIGMVFENGAFGSLNDISTTYGFGRNNEIAVFGSRGTMVLNGYRSMTVHTADGKTVEREYPTDDFDCFVAEFDDFYQCIVTEGKVPKSSFLEGYKDLQTALAGIIKNKEWETQDLIK